MTGAGPEINDSIRLTGPGGECEGAFYSEIPLTVPGLMSYATQKRCVYDACLDAHVCAVQTLRGKKNVTETQHMEHTRYSNYEEN